MSELTLFQEKIQNLLPDITMAFWEPMSRHTSFRIGGEAEVMAFPENKGKLAKLLVQSSLLDIKPAILGAGTNVLAPDAGMKGLVICLKGCLDGMEQLDKTHIRVMSGVTMTRAAVYAAKLGLSGLEFAHGIPGTVGGGVYMNAGAYGGEIGNICQEVEIMDSRGNIHCVSGKDMDFSYRHSILEGRGEIVVSAVFSLVLERPEEILSRMKVLQAKRSASQPLDLPSAGSAFKRPSSGYAAAMIDQCGLRGFQVGNAAISQKHAGFAVNLGGATAQDVKELLKQVALRVEEQTGIKLEPEIRIW